MLTYVFLYYFYFHYLFLQKLLFCVCVNVIYLFYAMIDDISIFFYRFCNNVMSHMVYMNLSDASNITGCSYT